MARVIRAASAREETGGEVAGAGAGAAGEARALARKIVRAAEDEAERIRASAAEEARRERSLAAAARVAAEEERRRAGAALEADVAGLALAVAAKLLGRAADADEGLAREMARRALARLPTTTEVLIRVNPADAASVRGWLPALAAAAPHAGRLAVREDAGVGRGGAVAESATAIADAGLGAQLAELARTLRGEG